MLGPSPFFAHGMYLQQWLGGPPLNPGRLGAGFLLVSLVVMSIDELADRIMEVAESAATDPSRC